AMRLRALADALPEARWSQPEVVEDEGVATPPALDGTVELTGVEDLSRYLAGEDTPAAAEAPSAPEATSIQTPDWSLEAGDAAAAGEQVFVDAGGLSLAPMEDPAAGETTGFGGLSLDEGIGALEATEISLSGDAPAEPAVTASDDFSFDWTPPAAPAEPSVADAAPVEAAWTLETIEAVAAPEP